MTKIIIELGNEVSIQDATESLQMAIDGHENRTAIYNLAIQALKEKQERDNPQALAVEDLRDMDGEPVWVVPKDECCPPHWRIWDNDEPCDTQVFDAYRYQPKEATHAES